MPIEKPNFEDGAEDEASEQERAFEDAPNDNESSDVESKERVIADLQDLAMRTGFEASQQMAEIFSRIEKDMSQEQQIALFNEWRDLAEPKAASAEQQVGLAIADVAIWLKMGNTEAFSEAIEQAAEFAYGAGLESTAEELDRIEY